MKKVLSITIGKVVFNIEEDAYQKLDNYLNDIRKHFTNDNDREEILEDIETSIAEKFLHKRKNRNRAISLEDTEKIIEQMGKVEDFENAEKINTEETTENNEATPKKLYRDPDDKILAGVASGIAAYFGIETVLVRLIFFITIFFGGAGIIAYLILWIVMPEAKTTAQKLEMRGERITLKEIEKNVKDGVEKLKKKDFSRPINRFFQIIEKIARTLQNILRITIGVVLLIAGIAGILALSFALSWTLTGGTIPTTDIAPLTFLPLEYSLQIVMLISIFLIAIIPLLIIFLLGLSLLQKKSALNPLGLIIILVIWFAAIGVSSSIVFENYEAIQKRIYQE